MSNKAQAILLALVCHRIPSCGNFIILMTQNKHIDECWIEGHSMGYIFKYEK